MNKILFYCSWGGFGHVARAYAVIKELPKNGKYFVATPEKWPFQKPNKNFKYINLPTPQSRNRFEGEKLILQKYDPSAKDASGYQKHVHEYINVLQKTKPDLVVVDNPAEIAIITKLLGYKTVSVYETLDTNDLRWRLVWGNVDKILVPYPKSFLNIAKFKYLNNAFCAGGYTRFDSVKKVDKQKARKELGLEKNSKYIAVTVGKGRSSEDTIEKICKATKDFDYKVLMLYPSNTKAIKNIVKKYLHCIHINTTSNKILSYLTASDMIISGAGYNSVMEVFYIQKPVIFIPLERVYNEQGFKTKSISKLGAAVILKTKEITKNNLQKTISNFQNKKFVKKMLQAQKSIADGKGSSRAANELVRLIKK
jgi:uncharacterized protein (TIGR00661 family)